MNGALAVFGAAVAVSALAAATSASPVATGWVLLCYTNIVHVTVLSAVLRQYTVLVLLRG